MPPYGFRPEGPVFDRIVIGALRDHERGRIEGMDPDLIEEAGECGLRPLAILLVAARARGLDSRVAARAWAGASGEGGGRVVDGRAGHALAVVRPPAHLAVRD